MFSLRKFTRLAFRLFRSDRNLILARVRITGRLVEVEVSGGGGELRRPDRRAEFRESRKAFRKCALIGEWLQCAPGMWALGVVLSGAVGVKSASAQCNYEVSTFVDMIPCEPIGPVHVRFFGLNEHGQACGSRGKCTIDINHNTPLPIVWTPELGLITLPLPEGATNGVANDINNVLGSDGFGQVICNLFFDDVVSSGPYLYDDGEWLPIGLPESNVGEGFALNDLQEIVGESTNVQFGRTRAFIWHDGVMEELNLPLGPNHSARAISDSSFVTGWMGDSFATVSHTYLWHPGSVLDLGTYPGGTTGNARGVNDSGHVTGEGLVQFERGGPTVVRSFIADAVTIADIGVLPERTFTRAFAINDANQIVGYCHNESLAGIVPFFWQNGTIHNLRDLYESTLPRITLPTAINDIGQIAGIASERGIILSPAGRMIGDVDIDCRVDARDLMLLLGEWGPCPDAGSCIADFVTTETFQPPPDGVVNAADLANLLGHWTGTSLNSSRRN